MAMSRSRSRSNGEQMSDPLLHSEAVRAIFKFLAGVGDKLVHGSLYTGCADRAASLRGYED